MTTQHPWAAHKNPKALRGSTLTVEEQARFDSLSTRGRQALSPEELAEVSRLLPRAGEVGELEFLKHTAASSLSTAETSRLGKLQKRDDFREETFGGGLARGLLGEGIGKALNGNTLAEQEGLNIEQSKAGEFAQGIGRGTLLTAGATAAALTLGIAAGPILASGALLATAMGLGRLMRASWENGDFAKLAAAAATGAAAMFAGAPAMAMTETGPTKAGMHEVVTPQAHAHDPMQFLGGGNAAPPAQSTQPEQRPTPPRKPGVTLH